jgi:hypothetical protein
MAATKKKDFSNVDTNPVYKAIAEATAEPSEIIEKQQTLDAQEIQEPQEPQKKQYKMRKTYTETEAMEALNNLQTSGRKGVKLPRINLAFTPDNYKFIKIMAQVRGQNLTEFVNDILREARENHAETYQKAIEFRNSL